MGEPRRFAILAGLLIPLVACAAVVSLSRAARAQPVASASASASAPALAIAGVPDEPGKRPDPKEWSAAPVIHGAEGEPSAEIGDVVCNARLLRGWIRITCAGALGVGLVAGDPKQVFVTAHAAPNPAVATLPDLTRMVSTAEFPIPRGESRIVSFLGLTAAGDYGPPSITSGPTLQVTFRKSDSAPLVIESSPERRW